MAKHSKVSGHFRIADTKVPAKEPAAESVKKNPTKRECGFLKKLIRARMRHEEEMRFPYEHMGPFRTPNAAEADDPTPKIQQKGIDIQSKVQEYNKAFYKYLRNQDGRKKDNLASLEKAFESLETEKPENADGSSKNTKSKTESIKPNSGGDKLHKLHFYAVLPEELNSRDDIEVAIMTYSNDCEKLLILKRDPAGPFSGQCLVSAESFKYIYVITYEGWSVLEWWSERQRPRHWDPKDSKPQFIYDGAILCSPDGSQNEVRLRGLLSMLPKISDELIQDSNAALEERVMTVCDQQLRLLEDGGVITSENHLYRQYKKSLENRLGAGISCNDKSRYSLPFNTSISVNKVEILLKELEPFVKEGWILLSIVLRLLSKKQVLELFAKEKLYLPSEELIAITVYMCQRKRDEGSSLMGLCQDLLKHIKPRLYSLSDGDQKLDKFKIASGDKKLEMFKIARHLLDHLPRESIRPVVTLLLLFMEDPGVREFKVENITRDKQEHPLTAYLRTIPGQLSATTDGAKLEELERKSHEEMLYWKELFTVTSNHQEVETWWSKSLSEQFEKRLRNLPEVNVVNFMYCYKEIPAKSVMEKIVTDVAFDRVFNADLTDLQKLTPNIYNLINHGLNDEKMTDEELVKKMLSWKNFCCVYQFCDPEDEQQRKGITAISWRNINKCCGVLAGVIHHLDDRTITIHLFDELLAKQQQFYELCKLIENSQNNIEKAEMRIVERKAERNFVGYFTKMLEHFWGYHEEYVKENRPDKWLEESKAGRLTFKAAIQPRIQDQPLSVLSMICEVIPKAVKTNLEKFEKFTKREYSKKPMSETIYKEHLRKAKPCKLTELPDVFKNADTFYQNYIKKFKDGGIKISEVQDLLSKYFDNQEEALFDEMDYMLAANEKLLGDRKEQVKIGLHLEDYYQGAETIMELKEDFTPQGNYGEFTTLFHEENKKKVGKLEINSITDRLVKCSKLIRNITPDQKTCLDTFFKSAELKTWITENVPVTDRTGFSKLVEEKMTTGDDNEKASRVVNALRGIYPLIYDVKDNSDYYDFISCCERVWGIADLKRLIADIEFTSKCVSWLAEFKTRFQKGFEVACVSEAEIISKTWKCCIGANDNTIKLEDAIELKIGEEKYNYQRINNLQNQLALVSREDKDKSSINYFFHFKDFVVNLSELLLDLRHEACVPFDNVVVEINKRSKEDPKVSIEIKLLENQNPKQATQCLLRQHTADFKDFSGSTDMSLVECFTDWRNRWRDGMMRIRSKYHGVNYYTTRQISLLRRELWEYQQKSWNTEVLVKAPDMLSLIHPVNASELKKLIESFGEQSKQSNQVSQPDSPGNENLRKENPLIKALLSKLSLEDLQILDYRSDKGIETFPAILLDMRCLNYVLEELEKGNPSSSHKTPTWIHQQRITLVGVPKHKTYRMVLSLYFESQDQQDLSRNQVLIITNETTSEDVEIFTYRVKSHSSFTFCMVNCHLLDLQKCKPIQKLLKGEIKDRGQLVCIYDTEARDCSIVRCLKKHNVSDYQMSKVGDLRQFMDQLLRKSSDAVLQNSICDRYWAHWINSKRSGEGKSLQVNNLKLKKPNSIHVTIAIHRTVCIEAIVSRLRELKEDSCNFIHFDISHEVQDGVDELLFNLLILGSITDSEGNIWIKRSNDFYAIECMSAYNKNNPTHQFLGLFPTTCTTLCISPTEVLENYKANKAKTIQSDVSRVNKEEESQSDITIETELYFGCDESVLKSERWQRVIRYLYSLDTKDVQFDKVRDEMRLECDRALGLLMSNCGLENPSWAELNNFIILFNDQLEKFDVSPHFAPGLDDVPTELRLFFVELLLLNAKDFSTRSLQLAEETPGVEQATNVTIEKMVMRRTWENRNQPNVFFSEDGFTLYPFGLTLKEKDLRYHIVTEISDETAPQLRLSTYTKSYLENIGFKTEVDYDKLPKRKLIKKLRNIMVKKVTYIDETGEIEDMFDHDDDPDIFYALTMDNAKKILAIHQRLRVNSPVIIMGETGCGKTMLLNYMSELQIPTELRQTKEKEEKIKPMLTVKVHGGTTEKDLKDSVFEAVELSKKNDKLCEKFAKKKNSNQIPLIYTILFFDEANTTENIGLIKEIICDKRLNGKPLEHCPNLRVVAACNPYRRHSKKVIDKLRKAGLGYYQKETVDKFAEIPMRELVYRVQPLPGSLLPLVWDFGTISNKQHEKLYIEQMIRSRLGAYVNGVKKPDELPLNEDTRNLLAEVLSESQEFMRGLKDECSYVSLRDVQRVLGVASWFYKQKDTSYKVQERFFNYLYDVKHETEKKRVDDVSRSILLALCVCYLAKLEPETRGTYTSQIKDVISQLCKVIDPVDSEAFMLNQFERCQNLFMEGVLKCCGSLTEQKLAKNKALKENVFMMIVSIENRIPLFVIGKPGSSKSLAKTLVTDAMRGSLSDAEIFREMKEILTMPYQCSEFTTADGIKEIFARAAKEQKKHDMNTFVSVVILDEVGLAEDSRNMPLKVLHPLLECYDTEAEKKCAFIGISNWALDPAKMNRGIFLQRGDPSDEDLYMIAKMILEPESTDDRTILEPETTENNDLIGSLRTGYKALRDQLKPDSRKETEFYSLRDYYSLVKIVAYEISKGSLSKNMLEYCIKRNFGGFDKSITESVKHFPLKLAIQGKQQYPDDTAGLIRDCLTKAEPDRPDSRYLLLLVDSLSILPLLYDEIHKAIGGPVEVIFGQLFRGDESYEQAFNNISRIKDCIRLGKPVILLNLDELYESLYDLLNQYFSSWDRKKFVDIGLGGERVNTPVHPNFRLIVVAEKETVYKQFPVPLISRLEKHFVSVSSFLSSKILKSVFQDLKFWAKKIVSSPKAHICLEDAFVGYSKENLALVVRKAAGQCMSVLQAVTEEKAQIKILFERSREILLWCVSGVALINLTDTDYDEADQREIQAIYKQRKHNSLSAILQTSPEENEENTWFFQLTTHAPLLEEYHRPLVQEHLLKEELDVEISLLSMQDIAKEHNLTAELRNFYKMAMAGSKKRLLIIQCEEAHKHRELICSVRFLIQREFHGRAGSTPCYTMLLLNVPRGAPPISYQGGEWRCAHIDHPQPVTVVFPSFEACKKLSPLEIFSYSKDTPASIAAEVSENFDITPLLSVWVTKTASQANTQRTAPTTANQGNIHQTAPTTASQGNTQQTAPTTASQGNTQQTASTTANQEDSQQTVQKCFDSNIWILCTKLTNPEFLVAFKEQMVFIINEWQNQSRFDSMCYKDKNWLSSEAFKEISADSLRERLETYFEKLFVPVIVELCSRIDFRGNLLILNETCNPGEEMAKLWIELFQHLKLHEIQVKQQQDAGVRLKFPFSWLVSERLDTIMSTLGKLMASSTKDRLDEMGRRFGMTELGEIIAIHLDDLKKKKILKAYVNDFFVLLLPHLNQKEIKICRDLLQTTVESLPGIPENTRLALPAVHIVYYERREKFQALSDLFTQDPDACDYLTITDMEGLEIDILDYMMERLKKIPLEEWLNDAKRCLEAFRRFQTLIDYILATHEETQTLDRKNMWCWLQFLRLLGWSFGLAEKNKNIVQLLLDSFKDLPKKLHPKDSFEEVKKILEKILNHRQAIGNEDVYKNLQNSVMKFLVNYLTDFVFSSGPPSNIVDWIKKEIDQYNIGRTSNTLVKEFFQNPLTRPFLSSLLPDSNKRFPDHVSDFLKGLLEKNKTEMENHAPTLADLLNHQKTISAARYLPDIVKLVEKLSKQLNSLSSENITHGMSINSFIRKFSQIVPEFNTLFESFITAWNILAPDEQKDLTSPLSELVDGTSSTINRNSLTELIKKLGEVSSRFRIGRCGEKDIYKLVFPHCSPDEDIEVKYDWSAIERDIISECKNLVNTDSFALDSLPSLCIRKDSTILEKLNSSTLAQEGLPDAEEILGRLTDVDVTTLRDYITNLQPLVDILAADPTLDGSSLLKQFSVRNLGLDLEFLSDSVMLKNIRSVWLLLKYKEAGCLKENEEMYFDEPSEGFLTEYKGNQDQLLTSIKSKPAAKQETPPTQDSDYEPDTVKKRLTNLCQEGQATLVHISKRSPRHYLVIGKNLSSLRKRTKEDTYLQKGKIEVELEEC